MKKFKVILTALAVVAVVGGALAFRATKKIDICYYSSTASHNGTGVSPYCNFGLQQDTKLGAAGDTYPYATTHVKVNGACPTTITCTQRFTSAVE